MVMFLLNQEIFVKTSLGRICESLAPANFFMFTVFYGKATLNANSLE